MELMKNLRWMCRVCAVNIRKRRSSSSAVPIFDTPGLLEKLRKYLHMDVDYNDKLPKSICINCFKKLESIYNFAVLAKKTENFLKDFISIAENKVKNTGTSQLSARFQNEFASFALLSADKQDIIICDEQTFDDSELEINLDVGDNAYKEMEKRVLTAVKQPLSPGPVQFIPVKSHSISTDDIPENLIGSSPPQQKNNLDQKRRNLKMVLANNNAQSAAAASATASTCKDQILSAMATTLPPQNQYPTMSLQQSSMMMARTSSESDLQTMTSNEPLVYDCLNLGCVIKDMDLLKLILKALKWPFTQDTLGIQIHRLKNTRFRDVMIDPNLLQDTDLIQILSSYLSPILLQNPNISANAIPTNVNTNVSNVFSNLHTYKIPADTSVHLVSVPIIEESPEKRRRLLPKQKRRPRRPNYKSKVVRSESPIEIISDDDNLDVQTFEVNVDPALYFPADSESQENSTESLVMSLVGKSKSSLDNNSVKVRKKQRRKQAHVTLHTDRDSGQELYIVHENGQEIVDFCNNEKSPSEKNDENVFNAESLDAQFPLVAIIDENSNDDAIWAEFKVVESPIHDRNGENLSNRSDQILEQGVHRTHIEQKIGNCADKRNELKNDIKKEIVDNFECRQIKTEPVDSNISETVPNKVLQEQKSEVTPETIDIKQEPESVENEENLQNREGHNKEDSAAPDTTTVVEDPIPEDITELGKTRFAQQSQKVENRVAEHTAKGENTVEDQSEDKKHGEERDHTVVRKHSIESDTEEKHRPEEEHRVDEAHRIEDESRPQEVHTNIVEEKEDVNFGEKLTERENERKPRDCVRNKIKVQKLLQKRLQQESKKYKETVLRTRSSSRVQSLGDNHVQNLGNVKRIPRSTRRFSYSPTKIKNSIKSSTRTSKRMCKQCGFVFKKSSDLEEHRRMHR